MLSKMVLKDTIDGIKELTGSEVIIAGIDGEILAATGEDDAVTTEDIANFMGSDSEFQELRGHRYFKVYDGYELSYCVIASGGSDTTMVGKLVSFQIRNLLDAYREHFDRDNFIKNLLLDNLLLVDVYDRARRLHIEPDVRRVVYIIEAERNKDVAMLETVKSLFDPEGNDFITAIDEKSIIIIKELEGEAGPEDLMAIAENIRDAIKDCTNPKTHIAYGNAAPEIREVSRSYKEARMALDVGKIFFEEQQIIPFSQLGIGRLIYQLPIPLCKMFIREIFTNKSPDDFDDETLTTIGKFFENSLNVSETSRQLFIHRNTLVYRLDKLQKSTGLDLRVFDDAITFKMAMMVVKYMKYMETMEY